MAAPNTNLGNKFPSMASVSSMQSMLSLGYLPPGHGYVPKKQKPDKPYGVTYISRMNRTIRGPGRKYMNYALSALIAAMFFFLGATLFLGHRNVSRMIVYRNEVFGPLMVIVGLCLISLMGHFVYKARVESNKWRANIRFHPEGLFTAAAFNDEYVPDLAIYDDLRTGTYGPKALKEIPKPKAPKKKKKKRRAQSKESLLSNDSLDSGSAPVPVAPVAMDPRLQYSRDRKPLDVSMERILEEPTEEYPAGDHSEPLVEPIGYEYQQSKWGNRVAAAAQPEGYYDIPHQPIYVAPRQPTYAAPEPQYPSVQVPIQQQQQYGDPRVHPTPHYSVQQGEDPAVLYAVPRSTYHTRQPIGVQYVQPGQYQPPPGLEESEL